MNTCCREHFVYICRMSISEPVTGACEPDADILDLEPEIKVGNFGSEEISCNKHRNSAFNEFYRFNLTYKL